MQNITILAGSGNLPKAAFEIISQDAKYNISVVSVKYNLVDTNYEFFKDKNLKYIALEITQVREFFEFLKQNNTKYLVIVGRVVKPNFESLKTDNEGKNLISKILKMKIFSDDFILKVITKKIEMQTGVKVMPLNNLARNIMASKTHSTIQQPTVEQVNIIKRGFKALKTISKIDMAQSIVISNAGILGVEGPEGTDELIKRCSTYYRNWNDGNSGTIYRILVKSSKKSQTKKADIPVIGPNTANMIVECGYNGIAIKAGEVIVLQKQEVLDILNKHNKFLYVY